MIFGESFVPAVFCHLSNIAESRPDTPYRSPRQKASSRSAVVIVAVVVVVTVIIVVVVAIVLFRVHRPFIHSF